METLEPWKKELYFFPSNTCLILELILFLDQLEFIKIWYQKINGLEYM